MTANYTDNLNKQVIKWLIEWRINAKRVGSNMEYVYGKALRSLKEHKDPIGNAKDFKQLKGFGDKLCKRIADKLTEINGTSSQDEPVSEQISSNTAQVNGDQQSRPPLQETQITDFMPQKKKRPHHKTPNRTSNDTNDSPVPKVTKTSSNRNYIPVQGSGAYGILMALIIADEDGNDCLSKQELQVAAQEFTTTSMTVATNGSHYTGWHSVKTLINKNLIEKSVHRMASFYLTDSGRQMAHKLYRIYKEKQKTIEVSPMQSLSGDESSEDSETSDSESIISEPNRETAFRTSSQSSSEVSERFSLNANSYEIVLCVDSREQTSGGNRDTKKTGLLSSLQQYGVKVEMRTLSVGDFAWIARPKVNFSNNMPAISCRSRKELVLDFVFERKRIDDLASSMKDRRWEEQKYRLINSGVRKPSYIIEYFGQKNRMTEFGGIEYDSLDQAIVNAQAAGFLTKRCESNEDTILYLSSMSRYLESNYQNKTIYSCTKDELFDKKVPEDHFMTFAEFSRNTNKVTNFTVSEMFLKHLLQIRGLSVNKAKVIVEHYPTLQSLFDAFSIANTVNDKQKLLASLTCGSVGRSLGTALSKKIFEYYCR